MYRYIFITIGLVLGLLQTGPASARVIEGRVIEIPDGATLTVLSREGASIHRVRLAGIDAPSMDHPAGGSSRENLRRMARGKTVHVDTTAIDSKGMLVGVVVILKSPDCTGSNCPEQVDPGLAQLTAGLVWIDANNLSYQPEEARKLYSASESKAKSIRVGLWRDYWVNGVGVLVTRQASGLSNGRREEPSFTKR